MDRMSARLDMSTENNIERLMTELCAETNRDRREHSRKSLRTEFHRYESKQQQLRALERWLRRCDGDILRQRVVVGHLRRKGAEVTQAEIRLASLLDIQAELRSEFLIVLRAASLPNQLPGESGRRNP